MVHISIWDIVTVGQSWPGNKLLSKWEDIIRLINMWGSCTWKKLCTRELFGCIFKFYRYNEYIYIEREREVKYIEPESSNMNMVSFKKSLIQQEWSHEKGNRSWAVTHLQVGKPVSGVEDSGCGFTEFLFLLTLQLGWHSPASVQEPPLSLLGLPTGSYYV